MLAVWFKTIFSFTAYHQLGKVSAWKTAFFMLYVGLVGILVFNVYFAWQIHQKLPVFIRNFPTITFEKGQLLTQEKITLSIPGTSQQIILATSSDDPPTKQEFLDKQIALFVQNNRLYMPSMTGVSSQPIPSEIDGKIDTQTLQTHAQTLRNLLQTVICIGSFLLVGAFFLFSYFMAWTLCFFWQGFQRATLPLGLITRWAVFLQGPALVLWIINLIYSVPLFVFAVFILFNIYVQQIFNTLPDHRGNHAA